MHEICDGTHIKEVRGTYSAKMKAFVLSLLNPDPLLRPSAPEILKLFSAEFDKFTQEIAFDYDVLSTSVVRRDKAAIEEVRKKKNQMSVGSSTSSDTVTSEIETTSIVDRTRPELPADGLSPLQEMKQRKVS